LFFSFLNIFLRKVAYNFPDQQVVELSLNLTAKDHRLTFLGISPPEVAAFTVPIYE